MPGIVTVTEGSISPHITSAQIWVATKAAVLPKPHNLGMLLQLPEHLFTQGIHDLRVNAGVLDLHGEHTDLGATPPELHSAGLGNRGTNGGIRSLTRGSVS